MSNSLRPHGLYSPRNSPGQNTGVGCHSLLQGIFPTQGSNPGLPHCRRILHQLSYQVYEDNTMREEIHNFSRKATTSRVSLHALSPPGNVIRQQGGGDHSRSGSVSAFYFQVVLRTLMDTLKGQARMQRNQSLGWGAGIFFFQGCDCRTSGRPTFLWGWNEAGLLPAVADNTPGALKGEMLPRPPAPQPQPLPLLQPSKSTQGGPGLGPYPHH